MAKSGDRPGYPQQNVLMPPEPSAASASEGIECGQELARRYLPGAVGLCAAIALGENEASLWTRLQAARLIAQLAGAIPEAVPEAPQPSGDRSAHAAA
jgi:hypothetical protein